MINRKDLINFVPKPKNSDVIIYDITLTDLIDVDVFYEYNKLLPNYLDVKNRHKTLKEKCKRFNCNQLGTSERNR